MLVGSSHGGTAAAEIAAAASSDAFVVDQVVTTGAPSSQVPTIPEQTRVLSLEDRSDPVALLGSLINTGVGNRLTVVYDGTDSDAATPYVTGGRAADAAQHPEVRAEIARIQELGLPGRLTRRAGPGVRGCRARTRPAGRGCGTRPSARSRRRHGRHCRPCPSAGCARG